MIAFCLFTSFSCVCGSKDAQCGATVCERANPGAQRIVLGKRKHQATSAKVYRVCTSSLGNLVNSGQARRAIQLLNLVTMADAETVVTLICDM